MLAPYRRLLARPHVRALVLGSILARMQWATGTLGVVLFVEERTGSFARAGLVAAAGGAAVAVTVPLVGRLMDRAGQTRVLLVTAALYASSLLGLVALGLAGAPLAALAGAAVLAGASTPPVGPGLRALWPELLRGEPAPLRSALALDAMLIEVIFVVGPLVAAVIVGLASPAALLVVTAASTATGTLLFAAQAPSRAVRGAPAPTGRAGPLRSAGMRTLLLAGVGIGAAFGALEVAFPAFAEEDGAASRAGLVFAAQGAGSALGGLVYGARTGAGGAQRAYLVLLAALAPSIALLALAGSLLTMLPLALLSGLVIAPLTAAENELLADVVPEGTLTEAYGWVSTSLVVGIASGNVLAGALVESAGWREAILAAAALSGIAAALALVRGRTLRLAP